MRHVRLVAMMFAVLLAAACSDAPTMPPEVAVGAGGPSNALILEPLIVVGKCDPIMSIDWCGGSDPGGGDCMTSTTGSDLQYTSGCYTGGGGGAGLGGGTGGYGGGGSTTPGLPPQPSYEGPGAFAARVGTLFILMGTTALMEPLAHDLYESRNAYDSAKRMHDAVMANNPSLEMEMLYEHRVEVAKNGYDGAVRGYAGGVGASILAVAAAVVTCSPGLLLPTP